MDKIKSNQSYGVLITIKIVYLCFKDNLEVWNKGDYCMMVILEA
jgi:hypothetical protein